MLALKKLQIAKRTLEGLGEFDIELWTDGSAEEGVRKGGAGVILRDLRGNRYLPPISVAAGAVVSSYRAEEVGIRRALQEMLVRGMQEGSRVLLCCDSLSVVQRLSRGPDAQEDSVAHDIWQLIARLFPKSGGSRLVVQWCPSHCGLEHNCEADEAAKQGSRLDQEAVAVDFCTAAAALQRASRRRYDLKCRRELKEHWYARATDFKPPDILAKRPRAVAAFVRAVMEAFPRDNAYPLPGVKVVRRKAAGPKRPRVRFDDAQLLQSIVKRYGADDGSREGPRRGRRRRGARPPRQADRGQVRTSKEQSGAEQVPERRRSEQLNAVEVYQVMLATLRSVRTAREEKRKRAPQQSLLQQR
eukprot:gene5897-19153_t